MLRISASLALVALLPSVMGVSIDRDATSLPNALIHQEWVKYQIMPNANHGLCLAPSSGDNGASLVLKSCDAEDTVFKYSSNSGKLKNIAHNICADVKDGVQGDGTPAQLWGCFQCNRNQMFDFIEFDGVGYYHIKWNNSPYCLDLKDGKVQDGAAVQLWNCIDYNDNQKWIVNPVTDEPYCDEIEGDNSASLYAEAVASEDKRRHLAKKNRLAH